MNSRDYWAQRKARELYEQLEDAEAAAEEMRQLYIRASNEIQEKARKIVRRFQLKHGLSAAEADKLLRNITTPEDIDELIRLLRLDPKNADLIAELEAPAYAARLSRLSELQAAVDQVAAGLFNKVRPKMEAVLEKIGLGAYYRQIFGMQKRSGAVFPFLPVDEQRLRQVLNTRWSGQNFSERLWGNTEELAAAVKEQILLSILTGKTQKQMAEAIDGRFSKGSNATRRLVRTEANYVANQMALESYKAHGVNKYIYVAILDLRTSLICRELDKKTFNVEDAQAGFNFPPMHPWCRSTTIAWIPPALLKKLKQAAIDPETGKTVQVPGDMSYNEWYEKYVASRSVNDYLASAQSDPAAVNEKQIFDAAVQASPAKVQKVLDTTTVEFGTRAASGYDAKNDILYIARGATTEEAYHEIGHLVEAKLIDKSALDALLHRRYKDISFTDLTTISRTTHSGIVQDCLAIKDPRFTDAYQGRLYANSFVDAFTDNGQLITDKLLEYVSVPYSVYMSDPATLKTTDPEMFNLIQAGVL